MDVNLNWMFADDTYPQIWYNDLNFAQEQSSKKPGAKQTIQMRKDDGFSVKNKTLYDPQQNSFNIYGLFNINVRYLCLLSFCWFNRVQFKFKL
ncbi:hypothetical protein CEXT_257511 [Caerostris extrusa]|uniref:Uncharacterized protein n=1 Tax=Caerostris extrusa TaxID=172846 RepID=A0AAV4S9P0_CAEEX|nr:hypothetical protein CEXT_257511 [Caerostris extrusa]